MSNNHSSLIELISLQQFHVSDISTTFSHVNRPENVFSPAWMCVCSQQQNKKKKIINTKRIEITNFYFLTGKSWVMSLWIVERTASVVASSHVCRDRVNFSHIEWDYRSEKLKKCRRKKKREWLFTISRDLFDCLVGCVCWSCHVSVSAIGRNSRCIRHAILVECARKTTIPKVFTFPMNHRRSRATIAVLTLSKQPNMELLIGWESLSMLDTM